MEHSTGIYQFTLVFKCRVAAKPLPQGWVERALVDILDVVANIQLRTLKAEVEKVSV